MLADYVWGEGGGGRKGKERKPVQKEKKEALGNHPRGPMQFSRPRAERPVRHHRLRAHVPCPTVDRPLTPEVDFPRRRRKGKERGGEKQKAIFISIAMIIGKALGYVHSSLLLRIALIASVALACTSATGRRTGCREEGREKKGKRMRWLPNQTRDRRYDPIFRSH